MTEAPSQIIPIILNLIAAIVGALGQWLYKVGSQKIGVIPWYKNIYLFSGMALFCLVMVLFVTAFKMGGRLSVVYPVYATTFVWGTLLAVYLDKEVVNWIQISGVGVVIVGVILIALGSHQS